MLRGDDHKFIRIIALIVSLRISVLALDDQGSPVGAAGYRLRILKWINQPPINYSPGC